MRRALLFMALAAGAASVAFAEADNGRIEYASPAAALAALRAKPDVTFREENDWIVAKEQKAASVSFWSFTTPAHPAHPSVVKRTLVERDGNVMLKMDVKCGATKVACDEMVRDFVEGDSHLREDAGRQ